MPPSVKRRSCGPKRRSLRFATFRQLCAASLHRRIGMREFKREAREEELGPPAHSSSSSHHRAAPQHNMPTHATPTSRSCMMGPRQSTPSPPWCRHSSSAHCQVKRQREGAKKAEFPPLSHTHTHLHTQRWRRLPRMQHMLHFSPQSTAPSSHPPASCRRWRASSWVGTDKP